MHHRAAQIPHRRPRTAAAPARLYHIRCSIMRDSESAQLLEGQTLAVKTSPYPDDIIMSLVPHALIVPAIFRPFSLEVKDSGRSLR